MKSLFIVLLLGMAAGCSKPKDQSLHAQSATIQSTAETWLFDPVNMAAQEAPAFPPNGLIKCWKDSTTLHFTCSNSRGAILDVESALDGGPTQTTGDHSPIIQGNQGSVTIK